MAERILMIGTFASASGGYPGVSQLLGTRLRERGFHVDWASTRRNPWRKLLDMAWRGLTSDGQVVIVDVFALRAFHYARLLSRIARWRRKRLFLILHGGELPRRLALSPGSMRRLFARADRIIAPSGFLDEAICAPLGFRATIIPNALERDTYPYRARREIAPRIFWLRAFHRQYRPDDAIRTVALLKTAFPAVSLVMAGPDKDGSLATCRALAASLGVADQVAFPGLITKGEIKEHGMAADLFLNTTSIDNTPVSVIEAMAMGMCVVSTSAGGIPYLLRDGDTGLLAPVGDPEALARQMTRLLLESDLAARISKQARAATAAFDIEAVLDRWEPLLRDA